ncbi:hypothetical protein Sjap_017846 [Stephania japonica]|uniref:Uncharacterized protein n=1 Tax=Stephania japonica TaxID=461633 RepID=A0AAP0I7G0_9MAGN
MGDDHLRPVESSELHISRLFHACLSCLSSIVPYRFISSLDRTCLSTMIWRRHDHLNHQFANTTIELGIQLLYLVDGFTSVPNRLVPLKQHTLFNCSFNIFRNSKTHFTEASSFFALCEIKDIFNSLSQRSKKIRLKGTAAGNAQSSTIQSLIKIVDDLLRSLQPVRSLMPEFLMHIVSTSSRK